MAEEGDGASLTDNIKFEKDKPEIPGVTVTSAPKTFKAEMVAEETILEVSGEFRPITGQNSSTSLSGLDTDFAKVINFNLTQH